MAYEQGVATSKEDFVDQLTTFAAANGWTLDEFSATRDRASIHINDVNVHFRWDAVASGGITAFQSLGYREEAGSATIGVGGTGYATNDTLTLSGGVFGTAATFNVDTQAAGVVTAVSPVLGGTYTTTPANPGATTGGNGTGCTLNVTYQGAPGEGHLDGSGNGDTSGAIDSGRRMDSIGNGPYTNHWFFADSEDGAEYLYAVLEYTPGEFRSFGAGEIVKFGTWTGGEWCGMTKNESTFGLSDNRSNFLVDGLCVIEAEAATMHAEGLPGQGGSDKWGLCYNDTAPGTDQDGNDRGVFTGGAREGFLNHALQGMAANPNNGFVPMVPWLMFWRGLSGFTAWRFMGKIPHIRELNGTGLVAGEEFTIGGAETWKVFPYFRKASSGDPHSGNAFMAIRKIV